LTAHKRLYRINERNLKWKWWEEKQRHSAKRDSAKREDTKKPYWCTYSVPFWFQHIWFAQQTATISKLGVSRLQQYNLVLSILHACEHVRLNLSQECISNNFEKFAWPPKIQDVPAPPTSPSFPCLLRVHKYSNLVQLICFSQSRPIFMTTDNNDNIFRHRN